MELKSVQTSEQFFSEFNKEFKNAFISFVLFSKVTPARFTATLTVGEGFNIQFRHEGTSVFSISSSTFNSVDDIEKALFEKGFKKDPFSVYLLTDFTDEETGFPIQPTNWPQAILKMLEEEGIR